MSPDTITNWIKAGHLNAQRTVGGQYRIPVSALRAFMRSRGMSTEFLNPTAEAAPMCWRFREERGGVPDDMRCDECPVKFLGVLNCFKLMGMHAGRSNPNKDCDECPYFQFRTRGRGPGGAGGLLGPSRERHGDGRSRGGRRGDER